MSVTLNCNVMRLYNGHRSFYASASIGRRRIWVQRWDVARTEAPKYHPRLLSRDRLMGWTWGIHRAA